MRRDVGRAIARFWKQADDAPLVGVGFALPYLRPFLGEDKHVMSVMLSQLGAMYWPADTSNHTVLATESDMPLADNVAGRILVCHSAEHSAHLSSLLQEIYRVLQPGGKALVVVPNRMGMWSSRANNPFGMGHPYQMSQMKHRAKLAGLTYVRASTALFYTPSNWRVVIRLSRMIEWLGRMLLPNFGGVLLVELEKQIYASIPEKGTPVAVPLLYPTARPAANTAAQKN